MLSRMVDGKRCRWEGGIWLIKEGILTPPLSSHYWHLKARIHISSELWCCVQMWSCVSGVLPPAEFRWEEMGWRHPADNNLLESILCRCAFSSSALIIINKIPSLLPHAKKGLIFYLVFFQKAETNEWKKSKKKYLFWVGLTPMQRRRMRLLGDTSSTEA